MTPFMYVSMISILELNFQHRNVLIFSFFLQLSTNGLVSFGVPFRQYWPVTFPYGQGTAPVLAPYWTDLDFRNDLDGSGLFYHVYDTTSDTKRDEAFLQEFYDRLSRYSDDTSSDFNPYWLMIVTWYQATPYYGKYNNDEVSGLSV